MSVPPAEVDRGRELGAGPNVPGGQELCPFDPPQSARPGVRMEASTTQPQGFVCVPPQEHNCRKTGQPDGYGGVSLVEGGHVRSKLLSRLTGLVQMALRGVATQTVWKDWPGGVGPADPL